jgi:hypothetical protein
MENHMKQTLFLAILTLCFFNAAVLAQTNEQEILAPGNPPLTREMKTKSVDFFQWVLGGNFNAEEANAYEQYLVRIWREKDAQSIKTIGEIVAMRDQLVSQTPEKIKSFHRQVQDSLLKEMRAQPEDALAKILLKSYDRIHSLNVKQGGNLPPQSQINNNSADYSAFVGEWEESYAGNSDHSTGANGGTFRSSDHAKNIIRFYSDGTYKSAFISQSKIHDGCKIIVSYIGAGNFSFDANTLHLNEKTRHETSRSCLPLDNYDKDLQPGNYRYPWQIGRDENGLKLVLMVNGKPHVFYKVEGTGVFGDE